MSTTVTSGDPRSSCSRMTTSTLATAIEQNRRRLWAICYRMTGRTTDADDLCHDAVARALARADQVTDVDPTGWLVRITTTVCLDHLRRETTRRRVTELIDWLDVPGLRPDGNGNHPERAAILREDVRYAVVVALQQIAPRQRAALILHDVCDRSLVEIANVLETTPDAVKQLLHRAREALVKAKRTTNVDVPSDPDVVAAIARAIETGSLDSLAALLLEDAWGVVDSEGAIPVATGPHLGRGAIMRRFANGWRRLEHLPMRADVRWLNAEPVVIVQLATAPVVVAIIHAETRAGSIVSLRVDRAPRRLAPFATP